MIGPLEVSPSEPELRSALTGSSIDLPASGSSAPERQIRIAGWVVGGEKMAIAVEIVSDEGTVRRFPCDHGRLDVAQMFPDAPGAADSGYEGTVPVLRFPTAGLRILAVLADQTRVPLGNLTLRLDPADSPPSRPAVSVIIPCRDQAHLLSDSIESVLRQDDIPIEILVVDDGSLDNTEEIVRRIPGVRYFRQRTLGLAAARAYGLRESRGDHVLFLDSGGRLPPGALASALECFRENPAYGLGVDHALRFGSDGWPPDATGFGSAGRVPTGLFSGECIDPPGALLFRREAFEKPLVFLETIPIQPGSAGALRGFSIDLPAAGSSIAFREIPIAGWVAGATRRAVAIEVVSEEGVLRTLPCDLHRPDVPLEGRGSRDPRIGFEGRLPFLRFPPGGMRLRAVLDDQTRVPIATVMVPEFRLGSESPSPLVSFVIPCYGQAHFLADSIKSILQQGGARIEILVVDDGSFDNTEEIVQRIPGVRYLRQQNRGLAGARNSGLRESRGRYVVFLDADDRLAPGALAASLACFRENPDYGLVAGHFRHVGLDGGELVVPDRRVGPREDYCSLLRDYSIGPPGAILFRRDVFEKVGLFDESISPAADYDMSIRVACEFPIRIHDQVVLDYRRHGASMSGNPAAMLSTTVRALRKQWPEARKSRETRRAYREGMRHWRGSWGRLLAEKVRSDLSKRRFRRAAREAWTLLLYHPRGLFQVVNPSKGTTSARTAAALLLGLLLLAACGQRPTNYPPAFGAPVPDRSGNVYSVVWLGQYVPAAVHPGATVRASVRFRNSSLRVWNSFIRLSYRWQIESEAASPPHGKHRFDLGRPVAPGVEVDLDNLEIPAPARPGRYRLTFELVNELVAWFSDRGAPVLSQSVEVR